jgi:hypothetical protein
LSGNEKLACFVFYLASMVLMMYIGNDLIESVPLDDDRISKPGYVGSFKRCLKMKYRELIQQFPDPPEFLVVEPARNAVAKKR